MTVVVRFGLQLSASSFEIVHEVVKCRASVYKDRRDFSVDEVINRVDFHVQCGAGIDKNRINVGHDLRIEVQSACIANREPARGISRRIRQCREPKAHTVLDVGPNQRNLNRQHRHTRRRQINREALTGVRDVHPI